MSKRDYEFLASIVQMVAREDWDLARAISKEMSIYFMTYHLFDPDIWRKACGFEFQED